jgi:hypothetical protein
MSLCFLLLAFGSIPPFHAGDIYFKFKCDDQIIFVTNSKPLCSFYEIIETRFLNMNLHKLREANQTCSIISLSDKSYCCFKFVLMLL